MQQWKVIVIVIVSTGLEKNACILASHHYRGNADQTLHNLQDSLNDQIPYSVNLKQ